MLKSKELEKQASEEDNDFKAFALHKKAFREQRSERFEDKYLPLLSAMFEVYNKDETKYTIDTQIDKYGIIDFFPKGNKLLIRKDNHWIKTGGLKWLLDNLIKL